jgi:hypothetical protein
MSSHDKRTSCVFVSSLPVCAHHGAHRAGGRRRIPHVYRRGHRSHRHELSQVPAPRRSMRASPPPSVEWRVRDEHVVENPREGASTGVTRATTCFDVGGDARALARTSFLGAFARSGPRARLGAAFPRTFAHFTPPFPLPDVDSDPRSSSRSPRSRRWRASTRVLPAPTR